MAMNETNMAAPYSAAPYKIEAPATVDQYLNEQRNRMSFKPVVQMTPDNTDRWDAKDVKLLLDTVRLTAPYTPEQLVKMQTFIGLLVEIKGMK